jgi:hypothetical protein
MTREYGRGTRAGAAVDQKFILPEEKELTRLEAGQTKLQERVTAVELEFETLKIETAVLTSSLCSRGPPVCAVE